MGKGTRKIASSGPRDIYYAKYCSGGMAAGDKIKNKDLGLNEKVIKLHNKQVKMP